MHRIVQHYQSVVTVSSQIQFTVKQINKKNFFIKICYLSIQILFYVSKKIYIIYKWQVINLLFFVAESNRKKFFFLMSLQRIMIID